MGSIFFRAKSEIIVSATVLLIADVVDFRGYIRIINNIIIKV